MRRFSDRELTLHSVVMLPWARSIDADHSQLRVQNKHDTVVYHLTGEASRFIYCFDAGASALSCILQMQEDYTY